MKAKKKASARQNSKAKAALANQRAKFFKEKFDSISISTPSAPPNAPLPSSRALQLSPLDSPASSTTLFPIPHRAKMSDVIKSLFLGGAFTWGCSLSASYFSIPTGISLPTISLILIASVMTTYIHYTWPNA